MKKISLYIGGIVLSILTIAVFSFSGCKAAETSGEEETAKVTETTEETVSEELPEIPSSLSIKVNPIPDLRPDFIKGVDVSMIAEIEKNGGVYYDTDGEQKDCLTILKNHGVNWIRLRLWNNPVFTADRIALENLREGNNVQPGDPVGGGNCDLESMKGLAQRAKALGMKFLLNFHYSDFWADPGRQPTPAAWVGLNLDEMAEALYEYTKSVLTDLKDNGAAPDMVAIGNEVTNGMCWPTGRILEGDYTPFITLLEKGCQAVREVLPDAKIMIHLNKGGENDTYRKMFDQLEAASLDYDVIGLSYYPYWDGPIEGFIANMNDISSRYDKEVVAAEIAYAFTTDNYDNMPNIFAPATVDLGGYQASVQGQATAIRNIMDAVAQVSDNKGLGVFYWEPDWIAVPGAGWVTGEGDAWENQAWWDKDGNPLESIWTYRLVSESQESFEPEFVSVVPGIKINTTPGNPPSMPSEIKTWYDDDAIHLVPIEWDEIPPEKYAASGSFIVEGTLTGTSYTAVASITVSMLKNPGFELGSYEGWEITGTGIKDNMETSAGNVHSGGAYAGGYWLDSDFQFTISQTIEGLTPGEYTVSAWSEGAGGEKEFYLFATSGDVTAKQDIINTGWNFWSQYSVDITVDESGTCTVGLYCDGNAGDWGTFDDFDISPK